MEQHTASIGAGVGVRRDPAAPAEGAIDTMLAGPAEPAAETRLDHTPLFFDLISHAVDCKHLSRCAQLVKDDLLEQRLHSEPSSQYTHLGLLQEQIETLHWIVGKLVDAGAAVDRDVEDLEDLVSSQKIGVRPDKLTREA